MNEHEHMQKYLLDRRFALVDYVDRVLGTFGYLLVFFIIYFLFIRIRVYRLFCLYELGYTDCFVYTN